MALVAGDALTVALPGFTAPGFSCLSAPGAVSVASASWSSSDARLLLTVPHTPYPPNPTRSPQTLEP